MNLEELKESIRTISLSHKRIKSFDYGENFLIATGNQEYPLVFLELPYSADYNTDRFKTFQFALIVLLNPSFDDKLTDHLSISDAEVIRDSIIQMLPDEIIIDSQSGLSLREFSDDSASGFRFDLTVRLLRTCINEDDFEPC